MTPEPRPRLHSVQRQPRAVFVFLAIVCAMGALCACGARTAAPAVVQSSPQAHYVRSEVVRCLTARGVLAASFVPRQLKASLRGLKGLTGVITWLPGPIAGQTPPTATIDGGALVFMQTAGDARLSLSQLAQTFVYLKGASWYTHAFHPKPPASALPNLESVTGNVALFWLYPRHHIARSDRLVRACVDHSQ